MTKSDAELRSIRDSVAFVGRLSDGLLQVGPFSLGLDGILAWAPGLGDVYSTVAGVFIIVQGVRAEVPAPVLGGAAMLMAARTVVGAIPLAGSAFADVFTAHKWAAAMIVRAIDARLGETGAGAAMPIRPVSRAPRRGPAGDAVRA